MRMGACIFLAKVNSGSVQSAVMHGKHCDRVCCFIQMGLRHCLRDAFEHTSHQPGAMAKPYDNPLALGF